MADNLTTLDASATTKTLAASDDGTALASKQVSYTDSIDVTLTRPADTSAYAAGDALTTSTSSPAAYTFALMSRINNGCGTILDAQLICSDPNVVSPPNFELFLFDANPTIPNDNAAFAVSDSELNNCVAVIRFYTSDIHSSSNNVVYQMSNQPRQFKCASGTKTLYGILKVMNALTPLSAATYRVKLKVVQDI